MLSKHNQNQNKFRIQINNTYHYQVFTHPLLNLSGRILIANELFETTGMHPVKPPIKNCHYFLPTINSHSLFNISHNFESQG